MIRIGEVQMPSVPRLLKQGVGHLLPHPTALILQQATVARLGRGGDVMGQIFPLTARFEDVQDPIENFPFVRPRPAGPRAFRQEALKILPLGIRHIRPVGLPSDTSNIV